MNTLIRTGRPFLQTNKTSTDYGLLSNESTAVMQGENIYPIEQLLVVGRKGVVNLKMLYDWWILYAIKHNLLIENSKYVRPNETLNALLADEYIKEGAIAGEPYNTQTYLRMIGRHLGYDHILNLSPDHKTYLETQERLLKGEVKKKLNIFSR